jgi:hypothetical protein
MATSLVRRDRLHKTTIQTYSESIDLSLHRVQLVIMLTDSQAPYRLLLKNTCCVFGSCFLQIKRNYSQETASTVQRSAPEDQIALVYRGT